VTPPGWDGLLEEGEEILWQGQPDAHVEYRQLISGTSLFGAFFAGFAIFWVSMAMFITSGMNDAVGRGIATVFPLFGLPFIAVGLYMVAGRLFWDAYQRRHTHYTLTNRAAFIATDIRGKRSLERHEITARNPLTLQEDTPGTVWFASVIHQRRRRAVQAGRSGLRSGQRVATEEAIGFRRIPEARRVFALMRTVQAEARARTPDSVG
jgi:hypothetical protein